MAKARVRMIKKTPHEFAMDCWPATDSHPVMFNARAFALKVARSYGLWIAAQLAQGHEVELVGLGYITATFKKGRTWHNGIMDCTIPDTYSPKFKASKLLRKKLAALAAKYDPNHFGGYATSNSKRARERYAAGTAFYQNPKAEAQSPVEGCAVMGDVHVPVEREERNPVGVEEGKPVEETDHTVPAD